MQFFKDTNFDFLGKRKFFLPISIALIILAILKLSLLGGINPGIDFAGGTELELKFKKKPSIGVMRDILADMGLKGAMIQEFGAENEILIRTKESEETREITRELTDELYNRLFPEEQDPGKRDLNKANPQQLALDLEQRNPLGLEEAERNYMPIAEAIHSERDKSFGGLYTDFSELKNVAGVTDDVVDALKNNYYLGNFKVVKEEIVGPSVVKELQTKTIYAIIFSMIGILFYIWFRFEFRFSIAAIAALVHDVLICLGIFAISGNEFNLPIVAALLMIIGYSLNDTIVVFDRIRDNLKLMRKESYVRKINTSINQTINRTVLTSLTTLFAVSALYLFGGRVIHPFAFTLLIGVIVGTYSSIFVASPILVFWESLKDKKSR